jgi:phage-related protein
MGLSVANILLEVTGESADAKRELADVARELALFSREEAEAVAYVDTSEASRELDELKVKLASIDAKEVSAEVNVKIAKAQADLTALQAELTKIDGEDVTVDVDVKRGIAEKLGALSGQIAQIGKDTETAAGGGIRSFISGILGADIGVGRWSTSLAKLLTIGPAVIAVVIALAGQLLAVAASAVSAVGAIGAMGVAFGAALIPGILLGIGAIARFKEQSEEAGTAAYALAGNVKDLVNVFTKATAGGADALFKGISQAIRDVAPLIESLGPAFTRLGKAGGDAFRLLGEHFSSPAWRHFFIFATDSLTKLTPLFARSFGAFAEILRNIATAAMPFLIQGFRAVAKFLEGIADKTSDIGALRDTIGGMVDSLRSWGHLMGGLIDLVGTLVAAFAPFGDEIVKSLGDGAENLAEWLRSSDGLDKIKQFFVQTGPLASELGKLILNVAVALIQIGELVAPGLTPVVHVLNLMLEAANKGLSFLVDHFPELLRVATSVILPITLLAGAFDSVKSAAGDAFDAVKGVVGEVVGLLSKPIEFVFHAPTEVIGAVRDLWAGARDVIKDVIDFVFRAPRDVLGVVRDIWRTARGVIRDVIEFVFHAPREVLGIVRDIWRAAKGIVTDAIDFVLKVPHDAAGAARDLWSDVKGIITDAVSFVFNVPNEIVGAARELWQKVKDAVSDGIDLVVHIVPDISGIPGKIADTLGFANGVENLWESMFAMVGEQGPELAFLPQGTDIYTAGETRNILKALGRGASAPAAAAGSGAPALGGGAGQVVNNYDLKVVSPGTGSPDPDIALAKLSAGLRARGGIKPA